MPRALLIQNQYEAFDQRALSVKALAAPLLGVGIAFGIKERSDVMLYATMLVAASLWLLEAIWKGFQYCLTDRIIELEAWFRGERPADMAPFQIYTAWGEVYRRERLRFIFSRMPAPFIALPYVVAIAAGVLAVALT